MISDIISIVACTHAAALHVTDYDDMEQHEAGTKVLIKDTGVRETHGSDTHGWLRLSGHGGKEQWLVFLN